METFLLQKFYDIVTEHFLNDLINKETYLKISKFIENQKELFTINLN